MLSKKLTLSLTSFVALIAFGLVCFAPSVFADEDVKKTHFDLDVSISAAESMIDVSDKPGLQIASGRHRNDRALDLDGDGASDVLTIVRDDEGLITSITDTDPGRCSYSCRSTFSHSVTRELPAAHLA